jgi:hypothetical protein
LVRQGKPGRFEEILRGALADARWCSADPVCIESSGQGNDSLNLAACHACTLLPETSCEEGNRLLDRAMLMGTPQDPEGGFFAKLVKQIEQAVRRETDPDNRSVASIGEGGNA